MTTLAAVTLAAQQPPAVEDGGFVNAAGFASGPVAPGSIISIFGTNLAAVEAAANSLPVPAELGGASVLVNGAAVPLFYVSPLQINAQLPFETPLGTARLQVASTSGAKSPIRTFSVAATAPGIFQSGDRRAIAVNNDDGKVNDGSHAAGVGSALVVYMTGQGAVDNPVETGAAAPGDPLSRPTAPVTATIGGKDAEVTFAGLAPGYAGLLQVNVIVPNVVPGDQPLAVKIGDAETPPALVAVMSRTQAFVYNNPFGLFIHFNMSTYADAQWATGDEPPSLFNPTNLDTGQWADAAVAAGMTFGVLTAKHHDGFSLWPTAYSTHNIAFSPYQNGHGDIIREYVNAFRARGLKVGLYFSIWDRHGQSTDLVKNQLRELLTQYGTINYLWFDGWGWQIPYTEIPYEEVRDFIRELSPATVVANNDQSHASATSDVLVWEVPAAGLVSAGNSQPADSADVLDSNGGWFYTTGTGEPRPAQEIIQNLLTVNSRNSLYLLDVGPAPSGQMRADYVERLQEIGTILRAGNFPINLAQDEVATQSSIDWGGDPSRAVDGNIDGNYGGYSVSHTGLENQPWWQVDLGSVQNLRSIEVWNRTDCCADRLSNFYILVSDMPFESNSLDAELGRANVSSYFVAGQGGRPTVITLKPGQTGRYVRVWLTTLQYLSLAEVRVF